MVHLLLLDVDLTPLGKVVREEDLTGVSPWHMGILVKEELTLGVRKLSMASCLVGASLVLDGPWCMMPCCDETWLVFCVYSLP